LAALNPGLLFAEYLCASPAQHNLVPAPSLQVVKSTVGNDLHSDPFFEELRGDPRFERINREERPTTPR
jgi:hypothetical protein